MAIGLERILRGRARFGEIGRPGRRASSRPRLARLARPRRRPRRHAVVVIAASSHRSARLVTWAIDEQRGPRGTPMLSRYVEFLGQQPRRSRA